MTAGVQAACTPVETGLDKDWLTGYSVGMTRDDVNRAANAMLDTLPAEGMPEGYAVAALQTAGIEEAQGVVAVLVAVGVLARRDGPRVVPGPKWGIAQAGLAAHRAGRVG